MNQEQIRNLAAAISACRRAATAGGHGIRALEIEVLLFVAGGVDTQRGLIQATSASVSSIERSLAYLRGRDFSYQAAGVPAVRSSPLRLIEHRQHPHQRGHQYRLSIEGRAILSPCLQPTSITQPNA
jgi:hypothetical protein